MLRSVDLSDYMLHDPVKILLDDDVFAAIALIHEHKVSGVCVVDGEGLFVHREDFDHVAAHAERPA